MPLDVKSATAKINRTGTSPSPSYPYEMAEKRLAQTLNELHAQPKIDKSETNTAPQQEPHQEPHQGPQQEPRLPRDLTSQLYGFIVADQLALVLGFLCAWTVAAVINTVFFGRHELNTLSTGGIVRLSQFVVLACGVIMWFERSGHYRLRMPFWMETKKVVETMGFAMLINGFLQSASRTDFSRLWLMSSWIFAAIGIILFRSVWRQVLRYRGTWRVPTLLVGHGETADEARLALASEPSLGYDIVTQIDDLAQSFQAADYSWKTLCTIHGTDYIVVALDGEALVRAKQPLMQLMREQIPFSVSPPLHYLPVLDMMPLYFFNRDVTLLTRNSGLDRPFPRMIKRTFDIVVSATTLLVLSPLLLILALLVKLDVGSALYSHRRLGLNGKTFSCLKFRSMRMNSEAALQRYLAKNPQAAAEWQSTRKLRRDPRVTKLGAFIRRSSLDELPQLINVLKGEMSIVGPRPIVVAETEKYDNNIVDYYRVRPGLTGLWQVSGRNNVSYGQRVRMDSWYVRNWSLWHDVMIICKTFPVIFKRHGAY